MNLGKKIIVSTLSTLLSGLYFPYTSLYLHSLYSAYVVALVTSLACVAC